MSNDASIDVWAPIADVRGVVAQLATDEVTEDPGVYTVMVEDAYVSVADVPVDGNVGILVDSRTEPDATARRIYDELVARTTWRLELYDADAANVVASRPALATA